MEVLLTSPIGKTIKHSLLISCLQMTIQVKSASLSRILISNGEQPDVRVFHKETSLFAKQERCREHPQHIWQEFLVVQKLVLL
jgi:hypothetical protein